MHFLLFREAISRCNRLYSTYSTSDNKKKPWHVYQLGFKQSLK